MTSMDALLRNPYTADVGQLVDLEQELESDVLSHFPSDLGAIVLKSPNVDGQFGAIGRCLEISKGFAEMAKTSETSEQASRFIYVFDKDAPRLITHSTRIIQPNDYSQLAAVEEIMDDLADQVDLGDVMAYHGVEDLTRCIFISTDL